MAKVKFYELEIVSLLRHSEKIIDLLQKKGVVQLSTIEENGLSKFKTDRNINLIKQRLTTVESAHAFILDRDKNSGNLLDSFKGRKEISIDQYKTQIKNIQNIYSECLNIVSKEHGINQLNRKIAKNQADLSDVLQWEGLDIQTSYKGTKNTRSFIGFFKGRNSLEDITRALKDDEQMYRLCHINILNCNKQQTKVILTCHKKAEQFLEQKLKSMNFSYPKNPTKHPPIVRINRLKREIEQLKELKFKYEDMLKEKVYLLDDIEFLIDHLKIKLDKYNGIKELSSTRKTMFLKGFIVAKMADQVKKELEAQFTCFVHLSDVEDEQPVLLANSGFSSPVEPITQMYALPDTKDIDPTSVMSFFYYLFYGMMLSDAGYGVLMVVATSLILKFKRPEGNMKKTLKMFFYCGISTIIWGALFGGWFGDIIQVVARDFFGTQIPTLALWYEPITDPIKLFMLSFLLGIIHLYIGYLSRFYMVYKDRGLIDAIFEVVPTMLLILGAAPLCANILISIPEIFTKIGGYMAIVAMILIVFTASKTNNILKRLGGGIYGLYNIASGSLSDVLSYSRLLALGLATGSIANVVNLMGSMPSNLVVEAIMLPVVFIVGHTLNIAINMLGAYVHTNRLQFVELFSKFYEGGGSRFKPLKANTNYIKIKE